MCILFTCGQNLDIISSTKQFQPVAKITGYDYISACDDIELDGSLSIGSSYEPLKFKWELLAPQNSLVEVIFF